MKQQKAAIDSNLPLEDKDIASFYSYYIRNAGPLPNASSKTKSDRRKMF